MHVVWPELAGRWANQRLPGGNVSRTQPTNETRPYGRRRSALAAAVCATVVLILAACGQAPAPEITLTLDSASADLVRGGEVQVQVTLTRSGGATADVALAVTGLPANVAANFSPATLTEGTLTSILTLTADAAAVEDDYDLEVTGAGTGLTATAALALDVVSLTVTGHVVGMLELPVQGALLASQGDTAVSDMNGSFTLRGLSVPYDVTVWNTAEGWLHVFEGLSSDELNLSPSSTTLLSLTTTRSTTVQGTLSGEAIPVPADQVVTVCIEGVDGAVLGCDAVAPTENSYSITVGWNGPASRQVKLHALQMEHSGGTPTAYPGYASLAMTLTDSMPTIANLVLGSALPTTTVDVEIDSPVEVAGVVAAAQLGPNLRIPVMNTAGPVTAFEVLMPVLPDVSYTFIAQGPDLEFGWVGNVTGANATVIVPEAPILVSPPATTTDVTTATVFTATNPAGGPITYLWTHTGGPRISVTTMSTTHSMPDPAEFGMSLAAGANGSWQVVGHSGTSTEAGSAGITDFFNVLFGVGSGMLKGLHGTGTFATSPTWSFTTAP